MIPTYIGLIVFIIGVWLLSRSANAGSLIFVMISTAFGAAAAIILPALGGSSIPPAYFALGFLTISALISPELRDTRNIGAYFQQLPILIFCLYGAVAAFMLPRLYQGQMSVSTLRTTNGVHARDLLIPLHFSSQNTTTAIYMIGTAVAVLAATTICLRPNSIKKIVPAAVALAWLDVGFGLLDLTLSHLGHRDWLDVFRNGTYAQLDQTFEGMVRIQGLFPEASAYANYAIVWFIFLFELWLRGVFPRQTGPAAAAMGLMLAISTSSSAYVSLILYGAVLALRYVVFPYRLPARTWLIIGAVVLTLTITVLAMLAFGGDLASSFVRMLQRMTVGKAHTVSGEERLRWARQGFEAFKISHGLGVGPGSFRSSSLFTAILGSTGVIGVLAFHLYLLVVIRPDRASTYGPGPNPTASAGAAAAWAAVAGLFPAVLNAPACDPGLVFGLLAGMAIAWRFTPAPLNLAATSIRAARRPRPPLAIELTS